MAKGQRKNNTTIFRKHLIQLCLWLTDSSSVWRGGHI